MLDINYEVCEKMECDYLRRMTLDSEWSDVKKGILYCTKTREFINEKLKEGLHYMDIVCEIPEGCNYKTIQLAVKRIEIKPDFTSGLSVANALSNVNRAMVNALRIPKAYVNNNTSRMDMNNYIMKDKA